MASPVDICNQALMELGDDTIVAFTDASDRAKLCNKFYPITRDMVLRAHPWKFATTWKQLAKLTNTPDWGLSSAFGIPNDCLRILGTDSDTRRTIWKVGNLPGVGKVVLSDDPNATGFKLKYIAQITDTSQYDPMFIDALAARLAHKLSLAITAKRQYTADMWQLYKERIIEARFVDSTEGSTEPITPDDYLVVR